MDSSRLRMRWGRDRNKLGPAAQMEWSTVRAQTLGSGCAERGIPDYASLHPGYELWRMAKPRIDFIRMVIAFCEDEIRVAVVVLRACDGAQWPG